MVKRKIVVKVAMNDEKKARKALMIAVSICGVESAAFVGSEKDQIVVTGEGIDPVKLAKSLRKCVGCTDIISVEPVADQKKPAPTEKQPPAASVVRLPLEVYPHHYYGAPPYHIYEAPPCNDSTCTIM